MSRKNDRKKRRVPSRVRDAYRNEPVTQVDLRTSDLDYIETLARGELTVQSEPLLRTAANRILSKITEARNRMKNRLSPAQVEEQAGKLVYTLLRKHHGAS